LIQPFLNTRNNLPDACVVIGFQVLALGLGPSRNEKYNAVDGQKGVENPTTAALALPRALVGTTNLPGTAAAGDDWRSCRIARDLILQRSKLVIAQLQIGPVLGERSDFDKR
jgi:hypothetical protein